MRRHLSVTAVLIISAALLVAASSISVAQEAPASGKKKDVDYAELKRAPEKAAIRRNPLDGDTDAAVAGGKLFEQHCAKCHGDMAEGGRIAPSLVAKEVQQSTPGTLFWILTNGVVRRGMPVWSKLPEPQRWQIVSYIKALGQMEDPKP